MIDFGHEFLIRAALGGIGVALIAGPLGCFVVWRRMAYFGAALSHSALLGVALGLAMGLNPTIGIVALCILVALAVVVLEQRRTLAGDTLLGILAHSSLALGIVAAALVTSIRVDLMAYLFGDILAIGWRDVLVIYVGAAGSGIVLIFLWRPLLAITVHEDMARVEGVRAVVARVAFMLVIAVVVAVGMKVVGLLLMVSMLIVPAAAARPLVSTPEQMAIVAALIGVTAVIGGLSGSWYWDIPAGPSIVVAATILFAAFFAVPVRR